MIQLLAASTDWLEVRLLVAGICISSLCLSGLINFKMTLFLPYLHCFHCYSSSLDIFLIDNAHYLFNQLI